MSDGCKDALGKNWNLYDGRDSLAYKFDSANINAPKFFDLSISGLLSNTLMGYWFPDLGLIDYFAPAGYTLATKAAAFWSPARNAVVVGDAFNAMKADQGLTLLHEALHAYTGLGDIALAGTLGLGTFDNVIAAGTAISKYLNFGCDLEKYKKSQ